MVQRVHLTPSSSHPLFSLKTPHYTLLPLLALPHIQPYNLGERFSGCYFYWIPNNVAEITVKCRRLKLVTLLWEPLWGQWDAETGARVEGSEVTGRLYTVLGKTQGNNRHIYRWLTALSGARAVIARFIARQQLLATNKGISSTGSWTGLP